MNYQYVPGYIGLKITNTPSWSKCISIMRKYKDASIAEIKTTIEAGQYILYYETTDTNGIRKIKKCYDELQKNGISVELYERDELMTRQILCNLITSHRITKREVESEIYTETIDD